MPPSHLFLSEVSLFVETDASETTISGVSLQCNKSVIYFKTFSQSEQNLLLIGKKDMVIIGRMRKW